MMNHNSIQCLMFILLHIEVIDITIYLFTCSRKPTRFNFWYFILFVFMKQEEDDSVHAYPRVNKIFPPKGWARLHFGAIYQSNVYGTFLFTSLSSAQQPLYKLGRSFQQSHRLVLIA